MNMEPDDNITITRAQLWEFWRTAIKMCADECDRADLAVGGESYRLFMIKHAPAGHGAMAHRLLATIGHLPPALPSMDWIHQFGIEAPKGWRP